MKASYLLNSVTADLQAYLQLPVVLLEDIAPKPQYPFVGYKLLFHNANQKGRPIERAAVTAGENDDIEVSLFEETTTILRLTACSDEVLEAYDIADSIIQWFDVDGYHTLKGLNIVVGKVSKTRNRDLLTEETCERRVVIDISLRTTKEQHKVIPIIKEINFKRESEVID